MTRPNARLLTTIHLRNDFYSTFQLIRVRHHDQGHCGSMERNPKFPHI
jgi:hypothetical protein